MHMNLEYSLFGVNYQDEAFKDIDCTIATEQSKFESKRKIPYAPRNGFRERMKEVFSHHLEMANAYQPLVEQQRADGGYLSCPLCQINDHVKSGGTQIDGTKKFHCCYDHSGSTILSGEHLVLVMQDDWKGNFSTFTSFEAYQLYRMLLVEAIVLFIKTNSTISGLASFLGVSRKFFEMAFSLALQVLQDEDVDLKVCCDEDFVLVFFDYSGCVLSRCLSLVLAKINGQLIWKIVCGANRLTIWDFIKTIKDTIDQNTVGEDENKNDVKYIFVTDGETSFVDPVGAFFPKSIHIRQFHKKELRGLVYIHFPGSIEITDEGKEQIQRYTISCQWDIVLEEGKTNDRTLAQRKRRKQKKEDTEKEKTKQHNWDLKLWSYVKYVHRLPSTTEKDATKEDVYSHEQCSLSKEEIDLVARPKVDEMCETEVKKMKGKDAEEAVDDKSQKNKSTYGHARRKKSKKSNPKPKPIVFKSISDAKENPLFLQVFGILVMVFGGVYIQSNNVENGFNVKVALKPHRAMKVGTGILKLIIHSQLGLRHKSATDLRRYFLDKISLETVMSWIIPHDKKVSEMKHKQDEIIRMIHEAFNTQQILAITYQDRYKRLTRRGILVQNYDEEYIGAYCFLRNEQRTFRIDRIAHAYLSNDNPMIFPST